MIKILKGVSANDILSRKAEENAEIEKSVKEIVETVRLNGDKALRDYSLKFDKILLEEFKVTEEEMLEAESLVSNEYKQILT